MYEYTNLGEFTRDEKYKILKAASFVKNVGDASVEVRILFNNGQAAFIWFAEYDTAIYWFTDSWRRRWGKPKSDSNKKPPEIRVMEW